MIRIIRFLPLQSASMSLDILNNMAEKQYYYFLSDNVNVIVVMI